VHAQSVSVCLVRVFQAPFITACMTSPEANKIELLCIDGIRVHTYILGVVKEGFLMGRERVGHEEDQEERG
jgi:hypothetical protein